MTQKIKPEIDTLAAITTLGLGCSLTLTAVGAGINTLIQGFTLIQGIGSVLSATLAGNVVSYLLEKDLKEDGEWQAVTKIAKYVAPLLAALVVNYFLFGLGAISISAITISQLFLTYLHQDKSSTCYKNYSLDCC